MRVLSMRRVLSDAMSDGMQIRLKRIKWLNCVSCSVTFKPADYVRIEGKQVCKSNADILRFRLSSNCSCLLGSLGRLTLGFRPLRHSPRARRHRTSS
jgi:hypothetical protein